MVRANRELGSSLLASTLPGMVVWGNSISFDMYLGILAIRLRMKKVRVSGIGLHAN